MQGGGGGAVAEDVNPKSHLMLINADQCLAPASNAGATRHSFRADFSELHLWRSGGLCRSPPNGKTREIKEVLSTDQVLLWSVSILHSLIIVVSCLVMTQSSSTENHYPGCVMR